MFMSFSIIHRMPYNLWIMKNFSECIAKRGGWRNETSNLDWPFFWSTVYVEETDFSNNLQYACQMRLGTHFDTITELGQN